MNKLHPILEEDFNRLLGESYIQWDQFHNTSILITGATGLIGSLVTKALLYYRDKAGANIRILILARNAEKVQEIYGNEQIEVILSDVRETFDVTGELDYIIHAAGVTTSKYMVTNPVETLMTSILGTDNLLRLARKKSVKGFVYLSSMEVYGVTTEEMNPITEEKLGYLDIQNVRSSYSEGKRACELLCVSYGSEYGTPVKIARLAQTFGAGVKESETKVYAFFAKNAISGKDIILHTAGDGMGNYCYTADVVGALLCLLTRGGVGEAYTIVNSANSMEIKDMAALVADKYGCRIKFDIPSDNVYGYAPVSKMKLSGKKMESLGWKAKIGLEEMYERMIAYWRDTEAKDGQIK